jgi:hypothetical protein
VRAREEIYAIVRAREERERARAREEREEREREKAKREGELKDARSRKAGLQQLLVQKMDAAALAALLADLESANREVERATERLHSLSIGASKEGPDAMRVFLVSQEAASNYVASNTHELRNCCFGGLGVFPFVIPAVVLQHVVNFQPDDSEMDDATACMMQGVAQHLYSTAKVSEAIVGRALAEYFTLREDGKFYCVRVRTLRDLGAPFG